MSNRVNSASTVDLETLAEIYCSWLPASVAELMYKDIVTNQIPPEELAGLFGITKEDCAGLLEGKRLELYQPIYANPDSMAFSYN